MSKRYAIPITEDNLDLIQVLNNGGEVKTEDAPTYFLVDITPPTETGNQDIKFESDLYTEEGLTKEDLTFL